MFTCNRWDALEKWLERFLKQMPGRQTGGSVSALSEGFFPQGSSHLDRVFVSVPNQNPSDPFRENSPSFACLCSLVAINPSNWDDPCRWAGGAHSWIISPPGHAAHWARTARGERDAELKHRRLTFPPVAMSSARAIRVLSCAPRCYSRGDFDHFAGEAAAAPKPASESTNKSAHFFILECERTPLRAAAFELHIFRIKPLC